MKLTALFERFAIDLTLEQAQSGAHQGCCDDDIAELRRNPDVVAELAKLSPKAVAAELKDYGAWEPDELADHDANLNRILWLACGNIVEEARS